MRILWVGDACVKTGLARVTHSIVGRLKKRNYGISVLGVNYNGDPHYYSFPIYPARVGGDLLGVNRIESICEFVEPDVIVINNDPWNIPLFLKKDIHCPVVAYMPIDAVNLHAKYIKQLNKLALAICYTGFGAKELYAGGYRGRIEIIPHGVSYLFHPESKADARRMIFGDTLEDYFFVGNVNRNQPRKRLDLTIESFAYWVKKFKIPTNVILLLHCVADDPHGYDLLQLAEHYGVSNRIVITPANMDENKLRYVYNCLDIQLTTTAGEGWGLTTMEGMACGVPQLVPHFAALGDWALDSVQYVEAKRNCVNLANTIGRVPDKEDVAIELNKIFVNPDLRKSLSEAGIKRVADPSLQWDAIATRFEEELGKVVGLKAAVNG